MPESDWVRRSARVVLCDDDRVLLVRSRARRSMVGDRYAWFVPGGGVQPGEALRSAAVREIAEETGLVVVADDLVHLAYTAGIGQVGDIAGPMRDDFFISSVRTSEVSTAGLEPHEVDAFDRYRWWHIAELAVASEPVFPRGLAGVISDYRRAQSWSSPAVLDW